MSNTLAIPNANPFRNYERQTQRAFPGVLIKFNKGDWAVGKEGEVLPVGTRLVPCLSSLMLGWQCWQNGEPADARMGYYVEGFKPAKRRELGDLDRELWDVGLNGEPRDPWCFVNALPFVSPNRELVYTFVTSSFGGRNAVDDLCVEHSKSPPGKYPLIELATSSYVHSKREIGRVKTPVFHIVGKVDAAPFDQVIAKTLGDRAPSTQMPDASPRDRLAAPASRGVIDDDDDMAGDDISELLA
jgi:hypothetical protein